MRYLPVTSNHRPILEFMPVCGLPCHYSFDTLTRWIESYASLLYHSGIRRGDRVCLYLSNSPELIVALFGNHLLGAISVPVNSAATQEEVIYIAERAEISALISDCDWGLPLRFRLKPSEFSSALECQNRDFPDNRQPEMPALLCFTSGTTARPKGVLLTHLNIRSNLQDLIQVWEWTAQDHLLLSLPLFHVHGLVVALHGWAMTGCGAVVLEKFDPARVLSLLSDRPCSLFMGVPTMYRRLLDAYDSSRHRFSDLRLTVTGSAPMSVELHGRCQEVFGHIPVERYGMTETLMNSSNLWKGKRKPGSVGLPLPSVRMRLMDDQCREIEERETPGEIWVQGPNVFSGYWRDPEATSRAFHQGWFRTGDLGLRDSEGYYHLLGRISVDLLKSGGYLIGAREIEEVLERHPAVREAAVVGLPDVDLGERVTAFVVAGGQAEIEEEELLSHCSRSLARYKCPRKVIFVPALPRNSMGKITKTELIKKPSAGE
ncbi:MAG: class I adenylate-forming enzyme family protein [Acidobacteriota bacterium]